MKDNRFPTKLYNLAYRLTGNIYIAEEIALEAIEQLSKEEISTDCDELLHKAACQISDLIRNQYSHSIQLSLAQNDNYYQMQIALNNLSVEERLVLVLREICQFSYEQIGSIMREDSKVSQKLLNLARINFYKMFKENSKSNVL